MISSAVVYVRDKLFIDIRVIGGKQINGFQFANSICEEYVKYFGLF